MNLMDKGLIEKLKELCNDIYEIEGKWPVVIGSVGYVLLGYLDWSYMGLTKDIDMFSPNIDSFEVVDKLMEKGWYVVHYTFTNAVYIGDIPVEILSNVMATSYIPSSLYNHWTQVYGIRVMDAPAILVSQALYRDVDDLVKNLKKPISVNLAEEYLLECKDEIESTLGNEKYKIVRDRINKFKRIQEVVFGGDRYGKDNSNS